MLLHESTDLVRTLIEKRFSLFAWTDRTRLRMDFPDIDTHPVLSTIGSDEDLLFCAFMGNPCSPVVNSKLSSHVERVMVAGQAAYRRNWKSKESAYCKVLPDHIAAGIEAFARLDLGARVQVRLLAEKTLINARHVLNIDVTKDFIKPDGKLDMDGIEQWSKVAKNMNALLQDVIPQCEQGKYLVTEVTDDTAFEEGEVMAILHARIKT